MKLSRRYRVRIQREDYYFARLSAMLANYSMRPPKEPYEVDDFMLTKLKRKPSPKKSTALMTDADREQLAASIREGFSRKEFDLVTNDGRRL